MVSGYFFWLIMSKITSPEIIGTSSAVVSLALIFTAIGTLGIPNGIQRFLGKSFSESQSGNVRIFVHASLLIVSASIFACTMAMLIAHDWIFASFNLDFNLTLVAILLSGSSIISTLFRAIIIASLKTKILSIVMIIASTAKLLLAIVLVLFGTGVIGLTIGYTFYQVLSSIFLTFTIVAILKQHKDSANVSLKQSTREIVAASMASWIPALITTISMQLGTVVVFGVNGANEGGIYFIAFSVLSAVTGVMYSLFTISYPVLSGMVDGRKRFAWRVTKLSLLISLPFSSTLIFYSTDIMRLLGSAYVNGAPSLEILLLSVLPLAVLTGVNTLVYSYGMYKQVLIIGLASSIPRTILYFALVPIYGSEGAAASFTIGSVVGLAAVAIIAKRVGMRLAWNEIVLMTVIPMALAAVLSYTHVHFTVGLLAIHVISYLALLKLHVISHEDIESLSMLPSRISKPLISILNTVDKRFNGS